MNFSLLDIERRFDAFGARRYDGDAAAQPLAHFLGIDRRTLVAPT